MAQSIHTGVELYLVWGEVTASCLSGIFEGGRTLYCRPPPRVRHARYQPSGILLPCIGSRRFRKCSKKGSVLHFKSDGSQPQGKHKMQQSSTAHLLWREDQHRARSTVAHVLGLRFTCSTHGESCPVPSNREWHKFQVDPPLRASSAGVFSAANLQHMQIGPSPTPYSSSSGTIRLLADGHNRGNRAFSLALVACANLLGGVHTAPTTIKNAGARVRTPTPLSSPVCTTCSFFKFTL